MLGMALLLLLSQTLEGLFSLCIKLLDCTLTISIEIRQFTCELHLMALKVFLVLLIECLGPFFAFIGIEVLQVNFGTLRIEVITGLGCSGPPFFQALDLRIFL